MNESVRPLQRRHARAAASLHQQGIETGFLSSLGPAFLRQIYIAVATCPSGFGYVHEAGDGNVLGFIACAESTGRLFKQALARRGVLMALPLARFLLRPHIVKRLWETLRYPDQAGPDLPAAEVLSIVVAEAARGRGVGKALLRAGLNDFARRGIASVKVAVGADNHLANAFYRRCGFELAHTRQHHGQTMNLYVAEVPRQETD